MRRMFIVGSDAFLVNSMRFALRYAAGINVLGVLDAEGSIVEAIRESEPDIVLIDAAGGLERALDHVREVGEERPQALVVLVADELDVELLAEAAEGGALVCVAGAALVPRLQALLADSTEPRNGTPGHVGVVASNGAPAADVEELDPLPARETCPLTKRELEILRAVAEGHTNARIGRELWVTEQTVKFHLSKIYRKLGVANRTEASRYALLNDLFATRRAVRRPLSPAANGNGHVNGQRQLDPAQR